MANMLQFNLSIYLLTYMRVFCSAFVANGLLIAWPKLDKWDLVETIWSLRFHVRWFQFYSCPHVNLGKIFLSGSRAILTFHCK